MRKKAETCTKDMTAEQISTIVDNLESVAVDGPSVIPWHMVTKLIAEKLAPVMLKHPNTPNRVYMSELINDGFSEMTARRTVKKARKLAEQMQPDGSRD
ncbi:hypothetical protein HFQ13_05420 [Acidithiobacillus sp. VAN18-1]|uniref:Uncharacterized protein n=1 Tax=Igneacidithiobacillus copahuensis TaxID=2724909 RepID=A0AAE2YPK5_9PROT|nr:hypothetical protein [Igneacidithiobacillus copahuensis]MBU2787650.1 hypothetical protein [Igneacidithiobacillus copahuensis]MBU2795986.1 hypothetical protein [Acidithiobacillus sp. VAN18-2]